MSRLLHLSDPHFGTERPEVVEALAALVRELRPDVLLLSGDITQRARQDQFASAARFLESLQAPTTLVIPGNHDIPLFDPLARLFYPYANFARAFGPELEPSFESAELLVVTVNTTRPQRHKHGEVSEAQIERVEQRLRAATPKQLRIVVTHQPVEVIRPSDVNNLLRGSERAAPRWCEAGADLVLGGHIHLPYVQPLSVRFPGLPRRTWAVQAGTAVSHRVRGDDPNSVNVVVYGDLGACIVERWDYAAATQEFSRVQVHHLPLDRAAS
jgi:3',5'-cyclic AMP phosphodiesterase CpdA